MAIQRLCVVLLVVHYVCAGGKGGGGGGGGGGGYSSGNSGGYAGGNQRGGGGVQMYGGGGGCSNNQNSGNCGNQQLQMPSATCEFDANCFQYAPECTLQDAYPYDRKAGISCQECLDLCNKQQDMPPFMCQSIVYDGPYQTCDLFAVQAVQPMNNMQNGGGYGGGQQQQQQGGYSGGQQMRSYGGGQQGGYSGGNSGGYGRNKRGGSGGTGGKMQSSKTPSLAKYPGRIYFQPTGGQNCGGNATTNGTAAGPTCPSGQTAKILAVRGYSFAGAAGGQAVSGAADEKACATACMKNQAPDGSALTCQSAQVADGKCTIATTEAAQESDLTPKDGASYLQKFCFPSDLVKDCPDIFEEDPQKILVGFARQVVDAGSFEECIGKCLNAQTEFGFGCRSGMFYYIDQKQNCILNTDTKDDHPDVFTGEDKDKVTYFELNCGAAAAAAGGRRSKTSKRTKTFAKALLDLPEVGNWTLWSPCTTDTIKQYRYRVCRAQKDVRKCEMDERPCHGTSRVAAAAEKKPSEDGKFAGSDFRRADALGSAECRALVESGKKNCNIGVRYVGTTRHYCSKPVNC